MASRVVGRTKVVVSEIQSTFLKHVLTLQQREQELMSMVEQVKRVSLHFVIG